MRITKSENERIIFNLDESRNAQEELNAIEKECL